MAAPTSTTSISAPAERSARVAEWGVRLVLCDDDPFMRETIESMASRLGHEVAGVADTAAAALGLIEVGRPDAVVLDIALGFDSDFDLIAAAAGVGAQVIVFSHHVDADVLQRNPTHPVVIAKPNLAELEQVLVRLAAGQDLEGDLEVDLRDAVDRRKGASRSAAGPVPTGVEDAQAFFEAVNEAQPGDGMVSLEVPLSDDARRVAEEVARHVRTTDRVLALARSVRVYLPGGGEDAAASLFERVAGADPALADTRVVSIVVEAGEAGPDAFDRLRQTSAAR